MRSIGYKFSNKREVVIVVSSVLSAKVALGELALAHQAKCSSKVLNGIFLPLDAQRGEYGVSSPSQRRQADENDLVQKQWLKTGLQSSWRKSGESNGCRREIGLSEIS